MQNNSQFDLRKLNEKSAKSIASTIEKFLAAEGLQLPHTRSLDLAGVLCGFENWQGLQAHVADQSKLVEMNFDAFEKEFKARVNPFKAGQETAFYPYGQELEFVKQALERDPGTVWTCTEGDDGGLYVGDGFHYVNVQFYMVTHKPAKSGVSYCIPWDHDLEDNAYEVRLKDMNSGLVVCSSTIWADDIEQASLRAIDEIGSELEMVQEEGGHAVLLIQSSN